MIKLHSSYCILHQIDLKISLSQSATTIPRTQLHSFADA